MMGQHSGNQDRLFYSFNLDDHVPANHLLRGINQFLDLSDLRSYLAPFYSHTGRPSIDPELMIRMLIVGYCFGIRSERRLCEELLNALSRLNDLQVVARTSSFSFKGKDVDVSTIAHKLNVGAVLEGSVRRAGNTVRITAQLINTVTGFHLWSETCLLYTSRCV